MLRRQVSSPSLKTALATIKSRGSAPNSPSLSHGFSPFNSHQGSALASPQQSPHFLDFYPTAPQNPTITKSRLESETNNNFFSIPVPGEPTHPGASRTAKGETIRSAKTFAQLVRFELPPIVIEGLPMQRGLAGFASFNFGNIHSVTYRSTCERLPTPYPLREDLDWLELQDDAELFALSIQEGPDSESSTLGISTKPSPSFTLSGFPTALYLSKGNATSVKRSPPARLQQGPLSHSKSLSALDTLANGSITVTSSSLSPSRPSARPILLSALSSALARRERSRRIRLEALPFATHLADVSRKSSQCYVPTPFPPPRAGRVLDPDLMFGSIL
ncbi:hypothetical protein BDM02DRAFT_3117250 [Thelephora ganbajun]|uniref:Uncharacterized protein n=1 Tax=Thelephora ganbajun TaxID=370292 RepID=A0ACB6ZCQ2_THEGA|nr:hypothetical protein BDM02DRAFT_3117250 [Thelephora ganbajun]